jgi:hypothetical protein
VCVDMGGLNESKGVYAVGGYGRVLRDLHYYIGYGRVLRDLHLEVRLKIRVPFITKLDTEPNRLNDPVTISTSRPCHLH